jgi:Domain of unknown function (DUF1906)
MASNGKVIYGIDRDEFPGSDAMRWLRKFAHIRVTGFYLTPAPGQKRELGWMGQRDALARQGWGFLPIYVGQQERPKPGQGARDAANAVHLMRNAGEPDKGEEERGFAKGSVVYLDVERSTQPDRALGEYILDWADQIIKLEYYPGIYGHQPVIAWAARQRIKMCPWLVQFSDENNHPAQLLDPSNLSAPPLRDELIAHQFMHECKFRDLEEPRQDDGKLPPFPRFDLNVCAVADPSNLAATDEALRLLEQEPDS